MPLDWSLVILILFADAFKIGRRITSAANGAFNTLRLLAKVRSLMSSEDLEGVLHALIHQDWMIWTHHKWAWTSLHHLQLVQNCQTGTVHHPTPGQLCILDVMALHLGIFMNSTGQLLLNVLKTQLGRKGDQALHWPNTVWSAELLQHQKPVSPTNYRRSPSHDLGETYAGLIQVSLMMSAPNRLKAQ